jgi:2-oxoisovalerate dehydrogenase E1 component alpha subunit
MTTVGSFHIDHTQYLDTDGEPVRPLPAFAQDAAALLPLYRAMVLTRFFGRGSESAEFG